MLFSLLSISAYLRDGGHWFGIEIKEQKFAIIIFITIIMIIIITIIFISIVIIIDLVT